MPWDISAESERLFARYAVLHNNAIDLIQNLWSDYPRTGIPPDAPLWLMFPDDPQAAKQMFEFMVGENLLVAPVVEQGARSRSVYLPAGCWQEMNSDVQYSGRRSVTVPAPLDTLPYFLRCQQSSASVSANAFLCSRPSGHVRGSRLGPVSLGRRRVPLRRHLVRLGSRGRRSFDFFCLRGGGIRVGYPSARLLHSLSRRERRRVQGRAILALTANRHYALHGVRHGARLASVKRRLHLGRGYRIGLNTWYLVPGKSTNGLLKVRHGVIEELGLIDKRLTSSRRRAQHVLESFD
jgi:hypothetical protein